MFWLEPIGSVHWSSDKEHLSHWSINEMSERKHRLKKGVNTHVVRRSERQKQNLFMTRNVCNNNDAQFKMAKNK